MRYLVCSFQRVLSLLCGAMLYLFVYPYRLWLFVDIVPYVLPLENIVTYKVMEKVEYYPSTKQWNLHSSRTVRTHNITVMVMCHMITMICNAMECCHRVIYKCHIYHMHWTQLFIYMAMNCVTILLKTTEPRCRSDMISWKRDDKWNTTGTWHT